jgi:ubiquinol-cytochrome c reductase iron-sulfur subunit
MTTHNDSPGTEVAVADRFENPGLPEHRHRMADTDPKAAKKAERQVAALFLVSIIGTLVALVAYFAVKLEGDYAFNTFMQRVFLSTLLLGVGMFLGLFGIGAGAIHYAKTLMPDEERIEERHELRGSDEDRAAAVAMLNEGAEEAGLGRRPLIRNTLIGALALFPIPGLVLFRDTGPMPADNLSKTIWKKGDKIVRDLFDGSGAPVKASDLQIGSVVHVMPEGLTINTPSFVEERAKAAVILIRLDPTLLDEKTSAGAYEGIVAFSKICTHLGCPVGLYEQQTHHLLCPCHQSTFDVTKGCEVIFGPAKRPMPQLPITVDNDGYLIAKDGFHEAVGPSFWERG